MEATRSIFAPQSSGYVKGVTEPQDARARRVSARPFKLSYNTSRIDRVHSDEIVLHLSA